jgi:hypothetical protein
MVTTRQLLPPLPPRGQLVLSRPLIKFQLVQVLTIIQSFSLSLSLPTVGAVTPGVAGAPTYPALRTLTLPLFRLQRGRLLHNVQSVILRNLLEVPTTCFAIFPQELSYSVFLSVPPLPRCDRCPELHPLMLFVVVLSFLRHSSSLPPRSFICLLPCSCCLRPRSFVAFLHSGPFQRHFPNVHHLRVSCATLYWSYL